MSFHDVWAVRRSVRALLELVHNVVEVTWPTVETVNLESDDDLVNWQIRTLFRQRYQPDTNNRVGFCSARGPEARRWES